MTNTLSLNKEEKGTERKKKNLISLHCSPAIQGSSPAGTQLTSALVREVKPYLLLQP